MAITKILFRRGTNASRQTVTLQLGEPGYSTDTKRLFIGDGTTSGGTPVGVINYGVVSALSGSYVYNSTNTNMASSAFILLSAANIGDFVYDVTTTSIWSVSSTTTIGSTVVPILSNFSHLYSTTQFNANQFYYNGSQLTIQNGQNGQGYGVGINELNSSVTSTSPTLSGGSGNVLTVKAGGIANNFLANYTTGANSVKISNGSNVITDIAINQNQFLGRTNASGAILGAVTLSATGSLTLSSNLNTILFNIPTFLPLSGGAITGGISALNANGGRFVTNVTPVNPYDVVNLLALSALSSISTGYLATNYLTLTGGTLSNPGNFAVNGTAQFLSNVGITGTLSANNLTINGTISALNGLSANGIQNFASPIVSFDVTNKAYTDSKFIPLSGGTFTGRVFNANTPSSSTEITNKAYVDTLQSFVGGNYLALSGGITTGALSATRFYTTNNPAISSELTTKNYVDNQINNSTPTGCVAYFASQTAPSGWIKANGAVLPIASYQNLFNSLPKQSNGNTIWWVAGDGPTNFRLPDLRGQFIRGWNDGISNNNTTNTGTNPTIPTADSGRAFGDTQLDQFQGHLHSVAGGGAGYTTPNTGGFTDAQVTTQNTGDPIADATNGTPRYGTETRPTNIALLACIKY